MEIVLADFYSHVDSDSCHHDGNRHVYRVWCIINDWFFRSLGGAIHIFGSGRIFDANTVSWIVLEVVVTQPKIHRDVFCSCNVVARLIHFYNVLLFPRLLL